MLLTLFLAAGPPEFSELIKREVASQECANRDLPADEVLVCGQKRRTERYRLKEATDTIEYKLSRPSAVRERAKWIEEGDAGIGSCSPVGPAGSTGCIQKRQKRARQQVKGWYG